MCLQVCERKGLIEGRGSKGGKKEGRGKKGMCVRGILCNPQTGPIKVGLQTLSYQHGNSSVIAKLLPGVCTTDKYEQNWASLHNPGFCLSQAAPLQG